MSNKSELSALFDGELEGHAVATAVRSALADEAQLADWQAYALIGDQLRGEPYCPRDFVESVMSRVRDEPVVLAPGNLVRRSPQHPLLALAASVAGVAVVGWLALAGSPPTTGPQVAYMAVPSPVAVSTSAVPPAPTFARVDSEKTLAPPVQQVRLDRAEMGEYMVAHHAHSSAFHLGSGAQHIRSVAMTGDAGRP